VRLRSLLPGPVSVGEESEFTLIIRFASQIGVSGRASTLLSNFSMFEV
jgi:hypothetical protein